MAEASMASLAAAWPGGWYVYENGKVEGPFSAQDAFSLTPETSDGKPRLVSRKGFTQWYALRDLSEIFRMTEHLGRRAEATMAEAEAKLAEASRLAAAARAPMAAQAPKVGRAMTGRKAPSMVRPVTEDARPAPAALRTEAAAVPTRVSSSPVFGGAVATPEMASILEAPSHNEMRIASHNKSKRPMSRGRIAKNAVLQEYFLQRGRLRLGKLRNPWVTGFLALPLSLGVLWVIWFGELARELALHNSGSHQSTLPHAGWALVPGVHMWMTYKLARQVVEMESQNKYRSVSPWLAAMFSLIPPFALAYLQDAANRHWMLHVKHALQKRNAVR